MHGPDACLCVHRSGAGASHVNCHAWPRTSHISRAKRAAGAGHIMAFSTWLVLGSLAILLHATVCAVQRARPQPGQTHTSHLTHTSAHRKANSDLHHHSLLALADREYLKAVQQPFIYSPFMVRRMHCHLAALSSLTFFGFFLSVILQISMQCIVAVLMGTWGVIQWQGSFMPIRTTEVLGKQYAASILKKGSRHVPIQNHHLSLRTLTPLRPTVSRRTIDNLEPGPDFLQFNMRELR